MLLILVKHIQIDGLHLDNQLYSQNKDVMIDV